MKILANKVIVFVFTSDIFEKWSEYELVNSSNIFLSDVDYGFCSTVLHFLTGWWKHFFPLLVALAKLEFQFILYLSFNVENHLGKAAFCYYIDS
jgi:hypothetical protein